MTRSPFVRLNEEIANPDKLKAAYDNLLSDLFRNPFWASGPTLLQRIVWTDGPRARIEDGKSFKSPGLYLWGVEEQPLYVGKTGRSFGQRFNRYIWDDRSQCNLAKDYESHLKKANGISGFPTKIRDWYAKANGGSTVRLVGAFRFAEVGIDKIWFALFPHDTVAEIRNLERKLIPVANKWNSSRGMPLLINKQN